MKLLFEILGYAGGFIMAVYSWPQIYKSITTKSTVDISLHSQLISLSGLTLIFAYCIYENLPVLYLPGAIECINILTMIYLKYKYGAKPLYLDKGTMTTLDE